MPDIIPRVPSPAFSDGNVPTAEDVARVVYYPTQAFDSLATINGHLDHNNLQAGLLLGYNDVQRGANVRAGSVGATTCIDYQFKHFRDDTEPDASRPRDDGFIPFLGYTYDVPWPDNAAAVRVFFHVQLITNNSQTSDPAFAQDGTTYLRLFVDGNGVEPCTVSIADGDTTMINPHVGAAPHIDHHASHIPDTRNWFFALTMTPESVYDYVPAGSRVPWAYGAHTVSLRIQGGTTRTARIKVRSMGVTLL